MQGRPDMFFGLASFGARIYPNFVSFRHHGALLSVPISKLVSTTLSVKSISTSDALTFAESQHHAARREVTSNS